MFTLEESALLGRMLRTTAVIVIGTIAGAGYLLVRTSAAPAPRPPITQPAHHSSFVPAHRHRVA